MHSYTVKYVYIFFYGSKRKVGTRKPNIANETTSMGAVFDATFTFRRVQGAEIKFLKFFYS